MDWEKLLSLELYHFLFIFARLSAAFLYMPFFSSQYISTRIRLLFVLSISVALTPVLGQAMPAAPQSVLELFHLLFIEVTVGLFMGIVPMILMTAIDLVGVNASMATSFSNATLMDPQTNVQSTVLTTFLTLSALVMVVVTNLHHIMIGTLLASYQTFPVGQSLFIGDMSELLFKLTGSAFLFGFQISSPFVLMIILLYSSMGVMSRLMPQLNIIFITMPLQVYLGLSLFMVSLPMIIWWFLEFFRDNIRLFAL